MLGCLMLPVVRAQTWSAFNASQLLVSTQFLVVVCVGSCRPVMYVAGLHFAHSFLSVCVCVCLCVCVCVCVILQAGGVCCLQVYVSWLSSTGRMQGQLPGELPAKRGCLCLCKKCKRGAAWLGMNRAQGAASTAGMLERRQRGPNVCARVQAPAREKA